MMVLIEVYTTCGRRALLVAVLGCMHAHVTCMPSEIALQVKGIQPLGIHLRT